MKAKTRELGAHPLKGPPGKGWRFRIFSGSAARIELVLQTQAGENVKTYELDGPDSNGIFEVDVEKDIDGLLYGYRVHGAEELFCDGTRLLLDPYVRCIGRPFIWKKGGFTAPLGLLSRDKKFDWEETGKPRTPMKASVIYEAHCRGMTMLHPLVPPEHRGTFLGLAAPAVIEHLLSLGVTAIELLPICYHLDERFLWEKSLTNYWGYNPIAYFAPHPRFQAGSLQAGREKETLAAQFKTFVREYHKAGLEVLLDVVYNHTGEGDALGPTVCFRGIDNQAYYRSKDAELVDWTGCGNTLNTDHPRVVQLICDSLRFWADEMQVDGFRFDLASALFRKKDWFDAEHPLFQAIQADPVLGQAKLIAEPWDATAEGYRVGQFPKPWIEWNDRYRDSTRKFWGAAGGRSEFATRLAGSSDLFEHAERRPSSGINFITAHDGFTMRDLVSVTQKQNLENGQDGHDGSNNNYSWNCGIEGETDREDINAVRQQYVRNFLTTLFLSGGVPMILGGDEMFRTQRGNNNPYCHDEDWNYTQWDSPVSFVSLIQCLAGLRKELRWVTADSFFTPHTLTWLNQEGTHCGFADWSANIAQPLVAHYTQALDDSDLLVMFNPMSVTQTFARPETVPPRTALKLILNTGMQGSLGSTKFSFPFTLLPRSMAVLRSA